MKLGADGKKLRLLPMAKVSPTPYIDCNLSEAGEDGKRSPNFLNFLSRIPPAAFNTVGSENKQIAVSV